MTVITTLRFTFAGNLIGKLDALRKQVLTIQPEKKFSTSGLEEKIFIHDFGYISLVTKKFGDRYDVVNISSSEEEPLNQKGTYGNVFEIYILDEIHKHTLDFLLQRTWNVLNHLNEDMTPLVSVEFSTTNVLESKSLEVDIKTLEPTMETKVLITFDQDVSPINIHLHRRVAGISDKEVKGKPFVVPNLSGAKNVVANPMKLMFDIYSFIRITNKNGKASAWLPNNVVEVRLLGEVSDTTVDLIVERTNELVAEMIEGAKMISYNKKVLYEY